MLLLEIDYYEKKKRGCEFANKETSGLEYFFNLLQNK